MAPTKSAKIASSSTTFSLEAAARDGRSKHRRSTKGQKTKATSLSTSNVPGVQKIKSLIRQTRRLLAKEKLAADVRQATERKMRALEKDLVKAERARKEKTMATRYHKVKFFERQKITRKIAQVKKQLDACSDKAEKKRMKKTLLNLRVDLNYIQHYPKTKKYISLFPPEVRGAALSDEKGKSRETPADATSETEKQREELRRQIREMMERGELSAEPESEAGAIEASTLLQHYAEAQDPTSQEVLHPNKSHPLQEDGFFGDDSDENEDAGDDMEDP